MAAKTPFDNPLNVLLDDVEKELFALKSVRPIIEQRANSVQLTPIPAENELKKVLGCVNCANYHFDSFVRRAAADQDLDQQSIKSRIIDTREEHP